RLHNSLLSQDVTTVGAVMYHLDADEQALLRLDGVTDDSIETIRERMDELVNSSEFQALLASEEVAEEAAGAEAVAEAEEAEPEAVDVVEAAEAVEEAEEIPAEAEVEPEAVVEAAEEEEPAAEEMVEEPAAETAEEDLVLPIDDLSVSLVDVLAEPEKEVEEEKGKDKKIVIVARPAPSLDQGRTEKAAE